MNLYPKAPPELSTAIKARQSQIEDYLVKNVITPQAVEQWAREEVFAREDDTEFIEAIKKYTPEQWQRLARDHAERAALWIIHDGVSSEINLGPPTNETTRAASLVSALRKQRMNKLADRVWTEFNKF